MARSAIEGPPPNPGGCGPTHAPLPEGAPAADPAGSGSPRLAASRAAAESGGSARRAFCAAIALDSEGKAPEWIQLFPAGPELKAADGRRWRLADPQAVADATRERFGGIDLKLDWEHGQDLKAGSGEKVPTAGWIKEIAVRSGLLMGRVEWTEAGRQSVESGEYRYVSPSFRHSREIELPSQPDGGDVLLVAGAGLVGRPAFDMPALAGRQEESMLKKILEALGLASDATEEKAVEAIAALKRERDEAQSQAGQAPPLAEFVPRADYDAMSARASEAEGKLAGAAAESRDAAIKQALDAAQEAGKITPATRPYYEAQCKAEGGLDAFKSFVESAPEIAGASGASGSPPERQAGAFASAEEGRIAKAFGRDAKFLDEHAPRGQGGSS